MKLGIEKTAMIRLRAGVSFALTEALDEGHCALHGTADPARRRSAGSARGLITTALDLERSEGNEIADTVGETPLTR
jgi:exodeoxyribonuclease V alpha subunit